MTTKRLGIVMHGITGRMGMNQHLIRSIVAIRRDGGVTLANGDRVMPDPILVGRNEGKIKALAQAHGVERWSTDLDAALANPEDTVFFDAATTEMRPKLLSRAIAAAQSRVLRKPSHNLEKHSASQQDKVRRHQSGVQDKLFLPGLLKLKLLRDSGFFGRILSVRGEFGYWVFEGDWQPIQRPSWNYRAEEGGGIILDMICHWRYVLDNTFGNVRSVSCLGATHIPERWDEAGKKYTATADDAAYATFELDGGIVAQINSSWTTRVRRDDLVTFHVDGTHGSAVAGLTDVVTQSRVNTPRPVWNPDVKQPIDFLAGWQPVPGTRVRQRLPRPVGSVHPPPGERRTVQVGPGRRRQGRAARRMRTPELERAPLDRRAEARRLSSRKDGHARLHLRSRGAFDQHRHGAQAGAARPDHRSLRSARDPHHLPLAGPGRGGRPRKDGRPAARHRDQTFGLLPRWVLSAADAAGLAAALEDNRRASMKRPRRSPCCPWSGRCQGLTATRLKDIH